MRIKIGSVLLAINILSVILILAINFIPASAVRIILGLPLVLFFPGYTLLIALFPRKEAMGSIQLLALSFGLSMALIPLIGLVMNYTPWGLRVEPIIYSLFAFLMTMSVVAGLRLRKLQPAARRDFTFNLSLPKLGQGRLERGLYVVLVIVILGALGVIEYTIVHPKSEKFTQFYLLGINGQAADYPTDFTMENGKVVSVAYGNLSTMLTEQWGRLTLGIVNHEGQDTIYSITMQIDGTQADIPFQGSMVDRIGPITLKPEETWEEEIGVEPQHTGVNQKVEIFLYKDGGAEPYLDLYLQINVR